MQERPSGSVGESTRRRRARIACNNCRRRRTRCSGGQPCSQCTDVGFNCLYQPSSAMATAITAADTLRLQPPPLNAEHQLGDLDVSSSELILQDESPCPSISSVRSSNPCSGRPSDNASSLQVSNVGNATNVLQRQEWNKDPVRTEPDNAWSSKVGSQD